MAGFKGSVLVTYGDTPLFQVLCSADGLSSRGGAAATVLTVRVDDPTGYGRIIRDDAGDVAIVEHKDASESELINEINTGTYCFDSQLLFKYLTQITPNNVQGEYYLPMCFL